MKEEKISLHFGNKRITFRGYFVRGLERYSGLMFSVRERAKILAFPFRKPVKMGIHSLFVFFPFLAVWADSDGKVMEIRIVKPFSWYVCPKKPYNTLVEIPLSRKYKKIIDAVERFK